jgi:N-acetylglucosaminyl-diphospho-decaprenol L-rhamnosyltransferase
MTIYISVVNHHHDEIIIKSNTLANLAKDFKVILKSNTPASNNLYEYCYSSGIELIQGETYKGFSENNNEIFKYICNKYTPKNNHFFLVLNPDVEINVSSLKELVSQVKKMDADISTINLYKNLDMTIYDYSIRKFPSAFNPIKSILKIKRNDFYDKDLIDKPISIDWAAGSFLLFKIQCFKELEGFDQKYFMYFEDVDICRRGKNIGKKIIYFPNIKAVHLAMHRNRNLFSKHLFWYGLSSIRYFMKKQ